ncbi:acetylxylan esterase [Phytoactinopolyspora halotolerans]|uniref:Acetylxylan esterase n=1 Tax=Phytoactinopolyspora halotolerans TaxID=1981512 RepID=A0A6L9SCV0_9ACTN|nr:acetylxylan esterase [Phytoactinopolyspora halotolerans]NEE02913.1 acetylxylan esterase [Phytoactinopolyspora halotolerans]
MRAPYDDWFGPDAFDATYGYDEHALRQIGAPDEPAGFERFWRELYVRARQVDPDPQLTPAGSAAETAAAAALGWDLYDLTFASLGDVRLGGWVALPSDGRIEHAAVVSHGYGGRSEPDLEVVPAGTAVIFPVSRGLPTRSLMSEVPEHGAGHVLVGIESPDTYVHGGCAADIWCAASALLELLPQAPATLGYIGGSFGGGIGSLALPWDARFTAAALHVPSFGNHPLRLTMPCTGSGESVRTYAAEHPEVRDVLAFFDAATAARHIRIPTVLAPALWDPAVPPPGQFAVCNAVAGEKEVFVFSAGHAEYPDEVDEHDQFVKLIHDLFRRPVA